MGGGGCSGIGGKAQTKQTILNDDLSVVLYRIDRGQTGKVADFVDDLKETKLNSEQTSVMLSTLTVLRTKPELIDELNSKREKDLAIRKNLAGYAIIDQIIKTQALGNYHSSLVMGLEVDDLNISLVRHNWESLSGLQRRVLSNGKSTAALRNEIAKRNSEQSPL